MKQNYHTFHASDASRWNLQTMTKLRRSNSWSQLFKELELDSLQLLPRSDSQGDRGQMKESSRLLNPSRTTQFDEFKQAYANYLLCRRMFNERRQVLKYVSYPDEPHKGLEPRCVCTKCRFENRTVQCQRCRHIAFHCSICRIPVRGRLSFCMSCGHGGHTAHIQDWFAQRGVCPISGCGCRCLTTKPVATGERVSTGALMEVD